MEKGQKAYELMVIFKPLLPDDVRKKSHESIVSAIKNLKGKVENADVWGKRYLAYPVAGHGEGYYIVYSLMLSPEKLKDFEKDMKKISEILRYLVVLSDGVDVTEKKVKKKVIDI